MKLMNAKRVIIEYLDDNVDSNYVKTFRQENGLTQVALANILGVSKKTIEKWEQGVNKITGSSAKLLALLKEDPILLKKLYNVKVYKESTLLSSEYKTIYPSVKLTADNVEQSTSYNTEKANYEDFIEKGDNRDYKWKPNSIVSALL